MRPETAARLGFLALIGGATGIGFAPILVRMSEVGPSATAFFRLLISLPLLWLWMKLDRGYSPASGIPTRGRDFFLLAVAGLLFTGDLSIWHWSLQFTTVTNSTLLTNVAPIFVTIGARIFFGDRITPSFVLGMLLAIAGAALLVRATVGVEATPPSGYQSPVGSNHLFGDALSILAAVFYAGYLLMVKHLRKSFSTPTIMAWSGLTSCFGFGMVAWLSGDRMWSATSQGWLVLVALALICHVGGQTLIAYGFGHLPASFSSVSLLWQPVIAAVAAWIFLGEELHWLQAMGAIVVLSGIAVASGVLKHSSRAPSSP